MRIGTCKLCLQTRELKRSHLIPAAMYRYIRDSTDGNPNPVVLVRKFRGTTSQQMTAHLLCAECEDLFNKNGEKEVLKWVWNGRRFPLGDRLAVAFPYLQLRDFVLFSGLDLGIDTSKFAYFALSVIWRAAVHQWNLPFGTKTTLLNLGAFQEPIRQFLHGEIGFPTDVVIQTTACTDPYSRTFYTPTPTLGVPGTAFGMLALGVHFIAWVGDNIPPSVRRVCSVRSEQRLIVQRDCTTKTLHAYAQLKEASKPLRGFE